MLTNCRYVTLVTGRRLKTWQHRLTAFSEDVRHQPHHCLFEYKNRRSSAFFSLITLTYSITEHRYDRVFSSGRRHRPHYLRIDIVVTGVISERCVYLSAIHRAEEGNENMIVWIFSLVFTQTQQNRFVWCLRVTYVDRSQAMKYNLFHFG